MAPLTASEPLMGSGDTDVDHSTVPGGLVPPLTAWMARTTPPFEPT